MLPIRLVSLCAVTFVLSVFCAAAWSQEPLKQDLLKMMRSDAMRSTMKQQMKTFMRSNWDGNADEIILQRLLRQPDTRRGLGISEEQFAEIEKARSQVDSTMVKNPEFISLQAELQKLAKPNDPMMQNADEATRQKATEIHTKMMQFITSMREQGVKKLLTAEQKQKLQEFQLATMSEAPVVSSKMFEALGLSDEQKKKMAAIKKELDPQFEQRTDEFVNSVLAMQDKLYEKIERNSPVITDSKEFQEKMQAATKEFEESGDLQKFLREAVEQGKRFTVQVKFRMFDVLTDEQMAKLQDIVDNPPDYVKKHLADIKKQLGSESSSSVTPSFMNAWKPGDPIPEEYLEKRNINSKRRFPKTEKE
ncbi:hypothetical protein FACS189419_03760 [Planctomycetales bacterium]|nr:hypothetical protein FACS189419_03760 [Planctomycetales bacterium]